MTVPDQGRPDPPPPPAWLDVTIRVAGWVFAVWGAVASAVLEAFLTPLRFHGYRMPLSLLLAAVLNAGLVVFAYRVTGRRAAVVASALAWFVVEVVCAGGTAEGDIVLAANNWVAIGLLLVGTLTLAVAAYLVVIPRPHRN